MENHTSFLTGFLSGQRLKLWQTGAASGDGAGGGISFYDWAEAAGGPDALTSPENYNRFVANLPPNVSLNSDETLTWKPTVDNIYINPEIPSPPYVSFSDGYNSTYARAYQSDNWSVETDGGAFSAYLNKDRRSWSVSVLRYGDMTWELGFQGCALRPPWNGTYNPGGSPSRRGRGNLVDGTAVDLNANYSSADTVGYTIGFISTPNTTTAIRRASALFTDYLPVYRVIPHAVNALKDIARPGILPSSPINEEASTFTNPLTGETVTYESFTYDPQTRTYTLTLENGNKMDVKFGDNGIEISEGLGGGEINVQGALYSYPNTGAVVVPEGTGYNKKAFLSGLAAGLASRGL